MVQQNKYSRDELSAAVSSSHSWRGVMRKLGRSTTSAGTLRAVRRQVDAFDIDHSHFTGQRRWSDRQLIDAISNARSWREVMAQLGVSDLRGDLRAFRTHAVRLGIDTSHLVRTNVSTAPSHKEPRLSQLRSAGPTLAAAWFMLCGYEVLWPLEPCRYDLAIRLDDAIHRVQVKTATYRNGGSFLVQLSNSRRPGHRDVYDVDEIDSFFVVDAELNAYWIPFTDVSGYGQISLRNYRGALVAEQGNWLQHGTRG
jgi:hypothetical protein